MLVEVRLLGEPHGAARDVGKGADEGPLARVDSQVVVEVVEFPEEFGAAGVVALEDLQAPVRLRVAVLDDPEIPRAGGHQALSPIAASPLGRWPLVGENLADLRVGEVVPPLEHQLSDVGRDFVAQELVVNVAQGQALPQAWVLTGIILDANFSIPHFRRLWLLLLQCENSEVLNRTAPGESRLVWRRELELAPELSEEAGVCVVLRLCNLD